MKFFKFFLILSIFLLVPSVFAESSDSGSVTIEINDSASGSGDTTSTPDASYAIIKRYLCGNGYINQKEECEFDNQCSENYECFSCQCLLVFPEIDESIPDMNIIFDHNVSKSLPYENLLNLFEQIEIPFVHGIARTIDSENSLTLLKNIKIIETDDSGTKSYKTIFSLTLSNFSNKNTGKIEIAEKLESFINIYKVKADKKLFLLDDFFGFRIENVKPKEKLEIKYFIEQKIDEKLLLENVLPATMKEFVFDENLINKILCTNVNCDDSNLCTTDSCSFGNCIHKIVPNLTPCGPGLSCFDGECIYLPLQDNAPFNLPPIVFSVFSLASIFLIIHFLRRILGFLI